MFFVDIIITTHSDAPIMVPKYSILHFIWLFSCILMSVGVTFNVLEHIPYYYLLKWIWYMVISICGKVFRNANVSYKEDLLYFNIWILFLVVHIPLDNAFKNQESYLYDYFSLNSKNEKEGCWRWMCGVSVPAEKMSA